MDKEFREFIVRKMDKKFDVENQSIIDIRNPNESSGIWPETVKDYIKNLFDIDEDYAYMITVVWLTDKEFKNIRGHWFGGTSIHDSVHGALITSTTQFDPQFLYDGVTIGDTQLLDNIDTSIRAIGGTNITTTTHTGRPMFNYDDYVTATASTAKGTSGDVGLH